MKKGNMRTGSTATAFAAAVLALPAIVLTLVLTACDTGGDSPSKGGSFTITNTNEWNAAIATIRAEGDENSNYELFIVGTVQAPPAADTGIPGFAGAGTVILKGDGILELSAPGPLFYLLGYANFLYQTLVIDGPTLKGMDGNTDPVVLVREYAALEMKSGKITGNTSSRASGGGGVSVRNNGSFTMTGGEISGNNSDNSGGGVSVSDNGSFTMTGGEISGNNSKTSSGGGGGVSVGSNSSSDSTGSFTMTGGEISGNTATSSGVGGGVYVHSNGSFSKSGGVIYGDSDRVPANGNATDNTATAGSSEGHAVYYNKDSGYYRNDTLDMEDDISTDADKLPTEAGADTGTNWIKVTQD